MFEKQFGTNWPEVIVELEEVVKKLKQARNLEERVDRAREIQKLLTKV